MNALIVEQETFKAITANGLGMVSCLLNNPLTLMREYKLKI